MKKICAVVIAYNNPSELGKCINAVRNQTYEVNALYVVDNSEKEYYEENHRIINKEFGADGHHYCSIKGNIGSAKGYAVAMLLAYKDGYDYIWMNDQDGIPDKDCLRLLIERGNGEVLVPNIVDTETKKRLPNFHIKYNSFLKGVPASDGEIDGFASTGTLLSAAVIKRVGVYQYEGFFVGNEDKEYALRIKKNGIKVGYVDNALYMHPDLYRKYNVAYSSKKIKKLTPLNLGYIYRGCTSERDVFLCVSSAFINRKYVNFFLRLINVIWSLIIGASKKNIDIRKTIEAYQRGYKIANSKNKEFDASEQVERYNQ